MPGARAGGARRPYERIELAVGDDAERTTIAIAFGAVAARLSRQSSVDVAVLFADGVDLVELAIDEGRTASTVRDAVARAMTRPASVAPPLDEAPGLRVGVRVEVARRADGEVRPELVLDLVGPSPALLFDPGRLLPVAARRFGESLVAALGALAREDLPLDDLPLLAHASERALLGDAEGPRLELAHLPQVHEKVLALAELDGGRVAVTQGDRRLTFAELARAARRVAARLIAEGLEPGACVGVCATRTPEMVVALLGVWMAGCAYVPLDPSHPRARLAYVLSDAGASVLVTDDPRSLDGLFGGSTITLSDALTSEGEAFPRRGTLAYVMYTSGSTGQPKGVRISHAALVNFLASMVDLFGLGATDRVLAVTTISFDISLLELFAPLYAGGSSTLATSAEAMDGSALRRLLEAEPVTLLQATPTTWRLLQGAGWDGTRGLRALCGGEPFPKELARELLPRVAEVWNMYGPTETTVWSTAHRVRPEDVEGERSVPIGRPIANTQVYVLDPRRRLVPRGAVGELYIGGEGLADGYHERVALTEAAFVGSPFAADGARLYRTGDLVAWREDGTLECLGRADQQVKLRGYRIELGEIEAALEAHVAVAQSAALVATRSGGAQVLVAYLVLADPSLRAGALREHLAARLPPYMVPAACYVVDAIPLGPSGKIDRKVLAAREAPALDDADEHLVEPRTETERWIAARWALLLGRDRVGANADFFDLGGDSLTAMRFLLAVRDERASALGLPELFALRTVDAVARAIDAGSAPASPPARIARTERPALSSAQQRLVLLARLDPSSSAYNLGYDVELEGELDARALSLALVDLTARCEALRTGLSSDGLSPRLWPEGALAPPAVEDLSSLPAAERLDAARRRMQALLRRPFALDAEPPLRWALFELGPRLHRLVVVVHHIAFDGPSLAIAIGELAALYRHRRGDGALPPEARCRFVDAVAFEEAAANAEAHLAAWTSRLEDAAPLELPTDRPRARALSTRGGSVAIELDVDLTAQVRGVARRLGTTGFMVLFAAFDLLLARCCGQDDVVVGTPVSLRTHPDTLGVVGFFVNTVPVRVSLGGAGDFAALVAAVQTAVLDAFALRDVPLDAIAAALRTGDAGAPPFRAAFALGADASEAWTVPGVRARIHEHPSTGARVELGLLLTEGRDRVRGYLEYDADLFDADRIEAMARHFVVLLRAAVADPRADLWRLDMRTAEERVALDRWNDTRRAAIDDGPAHAFFEEHARARPSAIALRFRGESLRYGELDAWASRVAGALRAAGVGRGRRVGLALDRGFGLVAAILGAWKAGAAYVPLDPGYPPERLRLFLEDSGLRHVLVEGALPAALEGVAGLQTVDVAAARIAGDVGPPGGEPTGPDDLAYVIYTSGSTGRPKGVELVHRGLCNLVVSLRELLHVDAAERVLQFASTNFDASVWEIAMALMAAGGTLVLVPRESVADPAALTSLLVSERVTIATLPPVILHELDPAACPVKTIISAGEACTIELVRRWGPGRRFVNAYGPTETTVCATLEIVRDELERPPPIGRPLLNMRAYVLGRGEVLSPPGIVGELCIGSEVALARGYLGQPELTAAAFVDDPFVDGGRMYRTGDLAAWSRGGSLEYVGRRDRQVKLRGHRIELDEIEHALASQPGGLRSAVVIVRRPPRDELLVGFVEPDARGFDADVALAAMRAALPAYMVPARLVVVDAMPVTPNGKIDRKALERTSLEEAAPGPAVVDPSASDPLEASVARLFAEALGVAAFGLDDSFFEHGGHSLMAARLGVRLHEATGVALPLAKIFERPTVRAVSACIRAIRAGEVAGPEALDFAADVRLDPSIAPSGAAAHAGAWREVLVTGATGFLGAHLVERLLAETSVAVCCLVRAPHAGEALARVRDNLARYDLWRPEHAARIRVVCGDLAAPRLGLDDATYGSLAEEIDAVLHNGAYVNHVRPYAALRPVNVIGTAEALRLACTGRPKAFHYVSTVDAVTPSSIDDGLAREVRGPDGGVLATGYAQSKWVAEGLVQIAAERGLPVSISRPAAVCGRAAGGRWNVGDFFTRLLETCLELGAVPDWRLEINVLGVDEVAAWIVDLFRAVRPGPARIHHVTHPDSLTSGDVTAAMTARGHAVRLVPFAAWRASLFEKARRGEDHPLVPMLSLFDERRDWDVSVRFANVEARKTAPRARFASPRESVTAFLRRHGPAVELGLSERVAPYFEALLAEPVEEPTALRRKLTDWVEPVTRAAARYPRLNVSLAWRLQRASLDLLDAVEQSALGPERRWVQASIEYLVREGDAVHDFEQADGLLDDLEVHNAVAVAVGREDLCVRL
ncbi:MAG: amino acid adenylation domain-containing protein [Labilithrix sp.]|nr:amino acid adenylation domain-containing protein [Labilithrix sp.]